jgi:hypothetical protein
LQQCAQKTTKNIRVNKKQRPWTKHAKGKNEKGSRDIQGRKANSETQKHSPSSIVTIFSKIKNTCFKHNKYVFRLNNLTTPRENTHFEKKRLDKNSFDKKTLTKKHFETQKTLTKLIQNSMVFKGSKASRSIADGGPKHQGTYFPALGEKKQAGGQTLRISSGDMVDPSSWRKALEPLKTILFWISFVSVFCVSKCFFVSVFLSNEFLSNRFFSKCVFSLGVVKLFKRKTYLLCLKHVFFIFEKIVTIDDGLCFCVSEFAFLPCISRLPFSFFPLACLVHGRCFLFTRMFFVVF